MKLLGRILLFLPLMFLDVLYDPTKSDQLQLTDAPARLGVVLGWRLKLTTAEARYDEEEEDDEEHIEIIGTPPDDWDWDWDDDWGDDDWGDDECTNASFCDDGGDGGGNESSNHYRPHTYAVCMEDASNDKEHCQLLASSIATLSIGLCSGFTFPPGIAACVAVSTVGGLWESRNCSINFNAHTRYCSELFP